MALSPASDNRTGESSALIPRNLHLIGINAGGSASWEALGGKREQSMSNNGIAFLILVVSSLTIFGGVLAWASWMEWREKKQAK